MKSSWELTWQGVALVLALAASLLLNMKLLHREKATDSQRAIELAFIDSTIAASEARERAQQARLDSLSVRDSLMALAFGKSKEFKLINDTTISNDSIRAVWSVQLRTRR